MNLNENYIMIFSAFHLCVKEEYFASLSVYILALSKLPMIFHTKDHLVLSIIQTFSSFS